MLSFLSLSFLSLSLFVFVVQSEVFWVSPDGNGVVCNVSEPCSVRTVREMQLFPGDDVIMKNGMYEGWDAMLIILDTYGSPSAPITFSAETDGGVLINGTNSNIPITVQRSEYVIIQGMDACCSRRSVVGVSSCNHTIVRRVCAWDAGDGNNNIFGTHYGQFVTFEDVAGWGVCRKTYSSSQGGDYTTIRRAFGRWERSTVIGPKMTFTSTYNNYHMLIENAIGTWSGALVPKEFELLDYYGDPWVGEPYEGWYYNHSVSQPYAIFGIDRNDGDTCTNSTILGSIAYVVADDLLRFHPSRMFFQTKLSCVTIRDCVAYFDNSLLSNSVYDYSSVRTFDLYSYSHDVKLTAADLTSIGATGTYFYQAWNTSNVVSADSFQSLLNQTGGVSVFGSAAGVGGADLCYRYENGVRTNTPLWPWPMNDRILAASILSGHTPIDVNERIQSMFGEIPSRCWLGSEEERHLTAWEIAGIVLGSVLLVVLLVLAVGLVVGLSLGIKCDKKDDGGIAPPDSSQLAEMGEQKM